MKNKKIILRDIGKSSFSDAWKYQEDIFKKTLRSLSIGVPLPQKACQTYRKFTFFSPGAYFLLLFLYIFTNFASEYELY